MAHPTPIRALAGGGLSSTTTPTWGLLTLFPCLGAWAPTTSPNSKLLDSLTAGFSNLPRLSCARSSSSRTPPMPSSSQRGNPPQKLTLNLQNLFGLSFGVQQNNGPLPSRGYLGTSTSSGKRRLTNSRNSPPMPMMMTRLKLSSFRNSYSITLSLSLFHLL